MVVPLALEAQLTRPTSNTALLHCGAPDTLEMYLVHVSGAEVEFIAPPRRLA